MSTWHTRDDLDAWIVRTVHAENEYQLPADMAGMRVLDIGGNIGAFARAALERGATVLSVEPDPGNAALYRRNLAAWSPAQVCLFEAAVAARDGTVRLYRGEDAAGFTTARDMHQGSREVQALSFAALLSLAESFWGPGRVDWCKVDAEGLEYALPGDFLAAADVLTAEFHDGYVDNARFRAGRVRKDLARAGFREERWDEAHAERGWLRLYRGRRANQ